MECEGHSSADVTRSFWPSDSYSYYNYSENYSDYVDNYSDSDYSNHSEKSSDDYKVS